MKLTSLKTAKAKQTRFGRFLCRLFGDQCGAVMMEYVVLGVLVVAAAVAIVMVFGNDIREKFNVMHGVLADDPDAVAKQHDSERKASVTAGQTAVKTGDTIGNRKGGGGGGD